MADSAKLSVKDKNSSRSGTSILPSRLFAKIAKLEPDDQEVFEIISDFYEKAESNNLAASISLLEMDNEVALHGKLGGKSLQEIMENIGKTIMISVRQSDITIRYSPYSVAIIFLDSNLKQATCVVQKLGGILTQVRRAGNPVTYCGTVGSGLGLRKSSES